MPTLMYNYNWNGHWDKIVACNGCSLHWRMSDITDVVFLNKTPLENTFYSQTLNYFTVAKLPFDFNYGNKLTLNISHEINYK